MAMVYFDFFTQENSQYQRTYVTRNGLVFNCLAGAYFMSIISTACTSKFINLQGATIELALLLKIAM